MKAVLLLSLALVLISATSINRIQLEEIIHELKKDLPQEFINHSVPEVIGKEKCTIEDICIAEKILSETLGTNSTISRKIRAYIRTKSCTLIKNGNDMEIRKIQLEEIIKELKKLPQIFKHHLVPDVIAKGDCTTEDFCKAENISSNTLGKNATISRLFREYTVGTTCTLIHNGKELEMRVLWNHLHQCVQKMYPQ
ncbi:hypothetical protein AAFF_G00309120 [Aldrovandia affinis]|uniref:Uncharacterized protein n=1 Tax=Aldrovandia affinis TaxID=143900 RepID=A0AAD7SNW0_9TELE|nr:hypothetical protein AAFF_G00309120 [Aldrovandia affinis]